jgi:pimeloyl-ACP methyl ester carboxylesterase
MKSFAPSKGPQNYPPHQISGGRALKRFGSALLLLLLVAGLGTSCALRRLKHEVKQLDSRGVLAVKVNPLPGQLPTYALAWPATSGGTNVMLGFQQVAADGVAIFLLRQNQNYSVGAFTDLNTNGIYDGGEPVAYLKNLQPTPLSDPAARRQPLALHLSPTNGLPPGQSLVLPREDKELGEALSITMGEIANLDDPNFSAAVGELGMWRPFEFLRQNKVGVYFLEPYDAKKLPVLFVYGISGSVQEWRSIIEKLDRQKYQPWLYQYPSGLRLDKSANSLASLMVLLRQQYQFERLAVVAHSMGGLVSRGAIQRADQQAGTNLISAFVSISTPWGGHQAAASGVKHLKFPVPSWHDMTPGSAYLKEILAHPLPPGTPHHLIFGYKSSGGLGLPDDNDGVVAVESELVPEVQEAAASVFGLPLDHGEILHSPVVVQKLHQALAR